MLTAWMSKSTLKIPTIRLLICCLTVARWAAGRGQSVGTEVKSIWTKADRWCCAFLKARSREARVSHVSTWRRRLRQMSNLSDAVGDWDAWLPVRLFPLLWLRLRFAAEWEPSQFLPPTNEVNIMFSKVSVKFGGEGVPMWPLPMMHYDMGSTPLLLLLRWVGHHWTTFQTCSLVHPPSPHYWYLVVAHWNTQGWQAGSTHLLECCLVSAVIQYNANLIQLSPSTGSQRCNRCRTVEMSLQC